LTGYAFSPYNIDRDINRKTKVIMHMGYMEGNKEDYTEMCGYYECEDCSERFMSLQIGPIIIVCSSCGEAQDMDSCQMLQLCIFYKSDTSL